MARCDHDQRDAKQVVLRMIRTLLEWPVKLVMVVSDNSEYKRNNCGIRK